MLRIYIRKVSANHAERREREKEREKETEEENGFHINKLKNINNNEEKNTFSIIFLLIKFQGHLKTDFYPGKTVL